MPESPIPQKESFSWRKYFLGIFNPLNTAKVTAHYAHVALLVGLVIGALWVTGRVKHWLFPSMNPSPSVGSVSGGRVENGNDKKFQIGLFNR